MRRDLGGNRRPVLTRYLRGASDFRQACAALEAGRIEDGRNLLKLAATWLSESRDDDAPALREQVKAKLTDVEAKLGLVDTVPPTDRNPGVASTQPSDIDVVFARRPRAENAEIIDAANAELAKKSGGSR